MNLLVRLQPWVLLGAAFGLGGCSTPTGTTSQPAAAVAPANPAANVAEWRHTATRDFEHEFPGKGLGVSRRYDSEDGWADVYIYDLRETWVDGCSDPKFAGAFDAACEDVRAAAQLGHYAEVKSDPPETGTAGALPVRWIRFSYRHQGKPIESYLLMTCARGHVLKARVSLFVPTPANAWASVQSLMQQQVRLIP
ncbi:hypothetical protein [Opitutus terrae]|uniref:Lipoprotein n=1 Tax=Opitutus terrae (strain DSM 11246 / JCM 15787 / PB90-1) TaxID=452637 RepID=B2A079_OPITP|nr:hypothetical protein [Opitutus terrae]ACB77415.1 hypothetical protein Oter_4141 [Opitutus terrae PB90-1]